jgi:cytochrome c553
MKHRHFIFILILGVVLATSVAWSQEEKVQEGIMDLKSREFGKLYEHSVKFDHYLHETVIRCRVCHHDFNVFSDMNQGKGSKCSSCHKKRLTKEIPIPLLMAFHKKCIGCHENYIVWQRKSGPIMCGFCHK